MKTKEEIKEENLVEDNSDIDMEPNYYAFDDYVMNFDLKEEHLKSKYTHSYRVTKECKNISESLNFSPEDVYISEVIGLLHDIGRFYQYTEFETFSDSKYFDHADYGVKILFEDNEIKNYNLKETYYPLVKTAIENHNKYKIGKCNEDEMLFSMVIRDADKLDILYQYAVINLKAIDTVKGEEICEEYKKDFFNNIQIHIKNNDNASEKVVRTLALIFDLNFDYSFEKVIKEKYIEKIYKQVNNKEILKPYFDEIKKYLEDYK